jgi:hypothetical protein
VSRFLATIATVIIIILVAGLAAPYLINWNNYRGMFENQASRLLGRSVRVGGEVALTLLPTPEIRFRQVQIAGDDGGFAEPFAEARAFTMVLSLGQLLSGVVEARRVELVDPVFRLSVDGSGGGNWRRLGAQDPSAAPFVAPREVSLRGVEISGGVLEFRMPSDPAPLRVEGVSGQFDAGALNGPFKFAGRMTFGGRKFEVRLSTGKSEKSGMKLRASLRSFASAEDYLFDGDLSGFDGPLAFKGPLTVRVGLAGAQRGAGGSAKETGESLEIKCRSLLTLESAWLEDVNLTLARGEHSQTLTGSARAEWGARSRLELNLGGRLFDLDPFMAPGPADAGRAAFVESAAALAPRILGALPFTPREGLVKLEAEQLAFAGESIHTLSVELAKDEARDGGEWRIAAARAKLPGDSQVSVDGAFAVADGG